MQQMDDLQTKIVRLRINGMTWFVFAHFRVVLESEVVPKLKTIPFHQNRRSRAYASMDSRKGRLFIKRYQANDSRLSLALSWLMKRTRARTEWYNQLACLFTGISVPEPLAFAERLTTGLNYQAYIIMRELNSELISLRQWMTILSSHKEPARAHALRQAAEFMATMHEHGAFHLDFTDANLWGRVRGDAWSPQVITDFEKYRSGAPGDDHYALAAVKRAKEKLNNVSPAEAHLLMKHYLRARGIINDCSRLAFFRSLCSKKCN